MARRVVDPVYVPQSVTVPAGTSAAAPLVTPCPLPHGQLIAVDVLIPPGHVGQTGIRFTMSGQQVLPWSNTVTWVIGDDIERTFAVDVETANLFNAVTFNTGFFPHTFYLRFAVRQLGDLTPTQTDVQLLDIAAFN